MALRLRELRAAESVGRGALMCIAAAARVLSVAGNQATVELNGRKLTVRIDLLKGVKPGDSVFCAAGMAVEKA